MDALQIRAVQQWSEQSNEGVLAFDRDGRILLLNARLLALLGLGTSPQTVEALLDLIRATVPELASLLEEGVSVTQQAQWGSLRIQKYHPQHITWQRVPIADGETIVGVLLILRDATTQGHTELSKQSFLSMISHDIRTPLSTILGFAELLYNNRDTISGSEQAEFLGHIIKNANQLSRYAQVALDVMYLEAELKSLETEAVPLGRFVEKWLLDASHRLAADQIVLANGYAVELFAAVSPSAMHRILNILVEFALAESPPDGLVNIKLQNDEALAHIVVEHQALTLHHDDISNLFRLMHPRDLSEQGRPQLHRMQLYVANLLAVRQNGFLTVAKYGENTYAFDLAMPLVPNSSAGSPA